MTVQRRWAFDSCEGECFHCHCRLCDHTVSGDRNRVPVRGHKRMEMEHVHPISAPHHDYGSPNNYKNVVAACSDCNTSHGSKNYWVWRKEEKLPRRCLGFDSQGLRCKTDLPFDAHGNTHYCKCHTTVTINTTTTTSSVRNDTTDA